MIQQGVHAVGFAQDVIISFASFMAAVFGHYLQYLKPCNLADSTHDAHLATFDMDGFIELRDEGQSGVAIGDAAATRLFLRAFRCSQMFERFCQSREALGIRLLHGNLGGRLQGNIFETLVQQSALRVGESAGRLSSGSHQRNRTDGSDAEMPRAGEIPTLSDGGPACSNVAVTSTVVDCEQLEQDDQLSAAELRAKSAAATDLFLASGLVAFFRVDSRAMIRSESARDSEEVGILEKGEIIKVSEPQPSGRTVSIEMNLPLHVTTM